MAPLSSDSPAAIFQDVEAIDSNQTGRVHGGDQGPPLPQNSTGGMEESKERKVSQGTGMDEEVTDPVVRVRVRVQGSGLGFVSG